MRIHSQRIKAPLSKSLYQIEVRVAYPKKQLQFRPIKIRFQTNQKKKFGQIKSDKRKQYIQTR
jgi:hypothetical protein